MAPRPGRHALSPQHLIARKPSQRRPTLCAFVSLATTRPAAPSKRVRAFLNSSNSLTVMRNVEYRTRNIE